MYQNNIATMKAVNAGQSAMGVIYHYYWYRDQALDKVSSGNTALHYFKNEDPGAFVSLSGAGVLASSAHAEDAQKFLAYLTSPAGQEVLRTTRRQGVRGRPRRRVRPGAAAPGLAAGPDDRPLHPQRPAGHRPHDRGGAALGDDDADPTGTGP